MARPTKLTPDLVDAFTRLIGEGAFIGSACAAVGISRATYNSWRKQAEEGTNAEAAAFMDRVRHAEFQAESAASTTIFDRMTLKQDWKACAWWLTHRFPSRWGGTPHAEETVDPPGMVLDASDVRTLEAAAEILRDIGTERLQALAALGPGRLDALLGSAATPPVKALEGI
jgi:hypothetical protein